MNTHLTWVVEGRKEGHTKSAYTLGVKSTTVHLKRCMECFPY